MADDVESLTYLADQAGITLSTWLSRAPRVASPDQVTLDLDPSGDSFAPVRDGALALRDLLEELGLIPCVETTGSRGLHVVVPLVAGAGFDSTRAFASGLARVLVDHDPETFTLEVGKESRRGRLYLDVFRNGYAQTAVAPYAVRPLPGAPVAAPLRWEELEEPGFRPRRHTLRTVVSRVEADGDPWAGMWQRSRSLREPARRLGLMPGATHT